MIFKNKIGRPSNEFKRRKNILKVSIFLFILVICIGFSFALNKINTKKISATVAESESEIFTKTSKILDFDNDKYNLNDLFVIKEKIYIIFNEKTTSKKFISKLENGLLLNENNWHDMNLVQNDILNLQQIKETNDNGFIISGKYNFYKYDENGNFKWSKPVPGDQNPNIEVSNDYIYVLKEINNNNIIISKYDKEGIFLKNISYNMQVQEEFELRDMLCYNNNLYLLLHSDSSYKIVNFLSDNFVNEKLINYDLLNIQTSEYSELYSHYLNENLTRGITINNIVDGKLELYISIIGTKNGDTTLSTILKKIIIDLDSLEVNNIIDINEDVFPYNVDTENYSRILLGAIYKKEYDIVYSYIIEYDDENENLLSSLRSGTISLGVTRLNKQGSFIENNRFDKVAKYTNSNLVPYISGNNIYMPYYDSSTSKYKLSIINYVVKNKINIDNKTGGIITLLNSSNAFKNGSTVNYSITLSNGFNLKSLKILDSNNNDITEEVNLNMQTLTFIMPDKDVLIVPEYENLNESSNINQNNNSISNKESGTLNKNPKTYDDVIKYVIIGIFTLVILLLLLLKKIYKKIYKK